MCFSGLKATRFRTLRLAKNSYIVEKQFELFQNYPNPFNSSTVIKFKIVDDSYVSLKIYDLLGREVVEFFKGRLKPGEYKEVFDGRDLNSGVYFYSLELLNEVDNTLYTDTKKFLIIK